MTTEQLESDRIKSLFPILNQHGKMINGTVAIIHVREVIEIIRSGKTIEEYEQILKLLEDENKES